MRALVYNGLGNKGVYNGPGNKGVEDRAKPVVIDAGDAIVRITRTTICGTVDHLAICSSAPAPTRSRDGPHLTANAG